MVWETYEFYGLNADTLAALVKINSYELVMEPGMLVHI
jgi:hypothetical protein